MVGNCEVSTSPKASAPSGSGREPPDKKDGQRDLSSGNDVPVAEGERCDKMAAA